MYEPKLIHDKRYCIAEIRNLCEYNPRMNVCEVITALIHGAAQGNGEIYIGTEVNPRVHGKLSHSMGRWFVEDFANAPSIDVLSKLPTEAYIIRKRRLNKIRRKFETEYIVYIFLEE